MLLKGSRFVPRVLVTDKLRSYAAAKRDLMPSVKHRTHFRLNNRAKNSHRNRFLKSFLSAGVLLAWVLCNMTKLLKFVFNFLIFTG
jgi:putative transposase